MAHVITKEIKNEIEYGIGKGMGIEGILKGGEFKGIQVILEKS